MMETDKKYLCDNTTPAASQEKLEPPSVGWTWLLIVAGFATTIGSAVPIGWNIGVINAPAQIIKTWMNESILERYDVSPGPYVESLIFPALVSIFIVGGILGSFSGAWLANKIGRKSALMVASTINIVTGVMFVAVRSLNSIEVMFIARLIAGIGSGLSMTVMPTYVSEIAPLELRGVVGVLCPLGVTFGVAFAQIIGLPQALGTVEYWHYLLGFYALLTVIGGIAFPWLPESPKFLYLIRGSKQEAVRELCRLRNLPEEFVCCELEENGEQGGESWTFGKLLTSRDLWLNLALVCAFNFGQQFSGINAVFYYSMSIFEKAGLDEQGAQLGTIATGLLNFVVAVVMIPLINLFPRRTISLISCSLATVCLVLLCFAIAFMDKVAWLSYMSIGAVLAYVVAYGLALGPIPYFVGTELFDVGPRPIAMALGTAANWFGNLTIGLSFPIMQLCFGAYSFLIFAASTTLLAIFIKVSLPETNVFIIAKKTRKASLAPMEKI